MLFSSGGKGGCARVAAVFNLPRDERRESNGSNGFRLIPESKLDGVGGTKLGEKHPLEGDSPTDGEVFSRPVKE